MLATPRWKWFKSYNEKSWSGTTRTIKYGPYISDQCLWIDDLLYSLESQKLKSFSAWNQSRAARFVTNYGKSWFETTQTINFGTHICDLCLRIDTLLHTLWETKFFRKSQIEALWCPKSVQNVCGLGTTNSQDMTSDRWFFTSSEMSVLHASHV